MRPLADSIQQNFGVPSPGAVNDKLIAYYQNLHTGSGSPEGIVSAAAGHFYFDLSGGVMYSKQGGSGAFGWSGSGTSRQDRRSASALRFPSLGTRARFNGVGTAYSNGVDTSGNYQSIAYFPLGGYDPIVVLGNGYKDEGATGLGQPVDIITVAYAFEYPTGSGTYYPITFNGALTAAISPGGYVVGQAVGLYVPPATAAYGRTFVSVGAGGKWPLGLAPSGATGLNEGGETGALANKTTSGVITLNNVFMYGPIGIFGTLPAASKNSPVHGLIGDSIGLGSGDTTGPFPVQGVGWFQRTFGANFTLVNMAVGASQANTWKPPNRKMKAVMLAGVDYLHLSLGVNDFGGGFTFAAWQSAWVEIVNAFSFRGPVMIAYTIGPKTSSTDNWATTVNQTPMAKNPDRVLANNWIRDGAPMHLSAGAWVADVTGTVGAGIRRIGDGFHPITRYYDLADLWESSRDSGLWNPTYVYVTDNNGIHPNTVGHGLPQGIIDTSVYV